MNTITNVGIFLLPPCLLTRKSCYPVLHWMTQSPKEAPGHLARWHTENFIILLGFQTELTHNMITGQ